MLARSWSENVEYKDPMMQSSGREELSALVDGVHAQFPEFQFRLIGTPDGFSEFTRLSWELGPSDGEAPIAGSDVVRVDDDGRIMQVLGFLDRMPSQAGVQQ